MPQFSGRLCMIYPELNDDNEELEIDENAPTMMAVFLMFAEKFELNDYIFCFEDKDKSGKFDRDPHYHIIFETEAKQDTMRRYLTQMGFKGPLASLHEIKDAEEYEKTIYYTTKHGNVVFTDYDHTLLDSILTTSRDYQEDLKAHNLTTDLVEQILKKLIGTNPDRKKILMTIAEVYSSVNVITSEKHVLFHKYHALPNGGQLLKMVQYIEQKVKPDDYINNWISDNLRVIQPLIERKDKTEELLKKSIEFVEEHKHKMVELPMNTIVTVTKPKRSIMEQLDDSEDEMII